MKLTVEEHYLYTNEQIILFDGQPVAEVWESKTEFSVETMLARWNAFEDGAVAQAIEALRALSLWSGPQDGDAGYLYGFDPHGIPAARAALAALEEAA